jgi:hypothetical protein
MARSAGAATPSGSPSSGSRAPVSNAVTIAAVATTSTARAARPTTIM